MRLSPTRKKPATEPTVAHYFRFPLSVDLAVRAKMSREYHKLKKKRLHFINKLFVRFAEKWAKGNFNV